MELRSEPQLDTRVETGMRKAERGAGGRGGTWRLMGAMDVLSQSAPRKQAARRGSSESPSRLMVSLTLLRVRKSAFESELSE